MTPTGTPRAPLVERTRYGLIADSFLTWLREIAPHDRAELDNTWDLNNSTAHPKAWFVAYRSLAGVRLLMGPLPTNQIAQAHTEQSSRLAGGLWPLNVISRRPWIGGRGEFEPTAASLEGLVLGPNERPEDLLGHEYWCDICGPFGYRP